METEPPPSSAVDEDKPLAEKPKSAAEAADFANYFCTYGFLYHQKQMLTDNLRMEAYYSAVFENSEHFKDKVVLDVGTGSGILAMWAARAGARKVYAVEYTDMARFARQLVADNRLSEIVEVIQGSVETIELPEKVDIIISEWMGYFLMRESMLDSVIIARDRFLKPTGAMYPSHARIYLAPITREQERYRAMTEFHNSMSAWKDFTGDMSRRFGVNFRCLTEAYTKEQKEYFLGVRCPVFLLIACRTN
jgi:protein arginine N-methyltransferase 1